METVEAGHDDVIGWFEHVSENAYKVQSETLRRILELNSGVEYLRKWLGTVDVEKMDDYTLETLFTSLVPIVSHADLDPYIQRIADGETSPLLTQEPITVLSLRYISTCIYGYLCLCVCDICSVLIPFHSLYDAALEQQKGDKSMFRLLAIARKLLFRFSNYQRLTDQGLFSFLVYSFPLKSSSLSHKFLLCFLLKVLSNKGRREDS